MKKLAKRQIAMKRRIKKAAVLGAGVMGSKIAALLAGVDIFTYLLDIIPKELDAQDVKKGLSEKSPEFRNKFARTGIENALKASPPAFYIPDDANDLVSQISFYGMYPIEAIRFIYARMSVML